MALLGAIVGQLGFGAFADLIGRRKVFIMTCSLVIFGALMSSTVQDTTG
jgi:MFS family permease